MKAEATPAPLPTKQDLTAWLAGWISRELKIDPAKVKGDETFPEYGMDSVHAMMMVGDLEEHLTRRLHPTLAWDFPTVDAMADYLVREAPPAVNTAPSNGEDADILAHLDELSEEEIDRLLRERLESKKE